MNREYELKQVQVRLKLSEAEPLYSTECVNTPQKAVEVMAKALSELDREYCCVVNMDSAKHPINFNIVSIGDVSSTQVPIQNVFKSAILSNAASIMLFHNHPSGSLLPSTPDMEVTKRLMEAGRIMNIPVLDHIIVAGGTAQHYSFRQNLPQIFEVNEHNPLEKVEEMEEGNYNMIDGIPNNGFGKVKEGENKKSLKERLSEKKLMAGSKEQKCRGHGKKMDKQREM
jgi:proteasome lid subunit RPN8/RPN11